MSTDNYTYSILKYRHSQLLDEQLNVGILVYFPETNSFIFKHSSNLKRVKAIYNNVSDKVILHYLKQIDRKLKNLDTQSNLFNNYNVKEKFNEFIHKELIATDASVLQFSKVFNGIRYNETQENVIDFLLVSYFSEYTSPKIIHSTIVDSVSDRFINKLASRFDLEKLEKEKKLFKDYKIKNETGKSYIFDYAWQNGTLNLVKPIDFNLKTSRGIEDKAHKHLGLFIDLQNEAEEQNLRYDLLVSRPKERSFYKDYDHALKLLELPKRLKIIEEEGIDRYSKKAIKALS
ncbi:DUF3037 domain-containing protein [Dokdonia sinensis]|uniref:DUF3037 domain-containing protein n=1 Tax=Dokdonia sinensis TaxID=2479847 RepID=UPI0013751487|nr:DUF3037 domain-containing protein [Dokdonia sinensis]